MPKGKSACGDWNFRVKRYVCPSCKRKGLYSGSTRESGTFRQSWFCMYKNCSSRAIHETFFRKGNDPDVLAINPEIKESVHNKGWYY